MQKDPSQVSSGNITPTIIGQPKDTKEVKILAGLVLGLAGLIAAAWYYGLVNDQVKVSTATGQVEHANVSDVFKRAGVLNQAEASTTHSAPVTAQAASLPEIIHADVYFEVGRKGLTDEAKGALSAHADLLKQHEDYGVLIQGYTDQQGSARYNMALGMKRAETVQAELLNAGILANRIKAVSLGEEGVLCVDNSDVCRHMNRRVHLEIRKIGQEHMAAPAVAATTAVDLSDPAGPVLDPSKGEEAGSITESLPPSSSESAATPADPAAGS
jgi:peptidoglycan-associated lipoprotein